MSDKVFKERNFAITYLKKYKEITMFHVSSWFIRYKLLKKFSKAQLSYEVL